MPTFLAPITVTDEFVTGNETISGNETILGVTSGKGSYWTSVSMTGGLTADSGSFVKNVSAAYFYGDGGNLTGMFSGNFLSASGGTLTGGLTGTEGVFTTSLRSSSVSGIHYGDGSGLTYLNASNISSGTLSAARLPVFNGDITTSINTTVSTTVVKLQGHAISTATPADGQILQWNGTAWVPGSIATGGSGGGGVVYYFDYVHYVGISPTAGLPTSPVAPSLLGREYFTGADFILTNELIEGSYSLVAGFVTMSSEPAVTNIPAGLWDFNIWMDVVGGSGVANQTQVKLVVHKYNPLTSTYTSLASSDDVYIYDPVTIAQYIANVTMPQTTLLSSDRIYIELYAQKNVNQSRKVRVHTDSLHPTHVHTTLPSVAGSGLVKTINGVMQTPASLLVDVDVAANAAIAQSKISGLTNVVSSVNSVFSTVNSSSGNWESTYTTVKANSGIWSSALTFTGPKIDIFTTLGTSTWTKPIGAKVVHVTLIAGGGGGGSGRLGGSGTSASGGGGGGGGARTIIEIDAAFLGATETVFVGGGGTGGGEVFTVGNGAPGATGGFSYFGLFGYASPGGGGLGGTTLLSNGGAQGTRGHWTGGGGGTGSLSAAGGNGGNSTAGCGGGGGGGVNAGINYPGGLGGFQFIYNGGAAAGTPAEQNGFSVPLNLPYAGSGGGGTGGSLTGGPSTGGSGGRYGAGGGGGGGSTGVHSGGGGAGHQGIVVVITYF